MTPTIFHPNDRPNFAIVTFPYGMRLAFSYETLIAFTVGGRWRMRENEWGPTTGKHMNLLDPAREIERIPGDQFEREAEAMLYNRAPNGQLVPKIGV